jgi:hypothetical protein
MKNKLLILIAALSFTIGTAQAGVIILIDNPNRTAAAGETIYFTGTLTNDSLTDPVSLDFDNINTGLASGSAVDHFFDAAFPVSLHAGAATGHIALFDIVLSNPLIDPSGTYGGTYEIDSGTSGFLGQATFRITVSGAASPTTEPATALPVAALALGLCVKTRRSDRKAL